MAHHYDGETLWRRPEDLVVEEPLTVRVNDVDVATTMRTPGHDFELAVGLLHADGALGGAPVTEIRYCATGSAVETEFNVVSVSAPGAPEAVPRLGVISSSCGLCGTDAIEDMIARISFVAAAEPFLEDTLLGVVDAMIAHQPVFDRTGGLHAAASFDTQGTIIHAREDIGRHNAVDKLIGKQLIDSASQGQGSGAMINSILVVSGRASFELVQKAVVAQIPMMIAVGAPSSLAVELAKRFGLTLVGFNTGAKFNVYSGNERID